MNSDPTLITIRVNKGHTIQALVDNSCNNYAMINENFAKKLYLSRVDRRTTPMEGFVENIKDIKSIGVVIFMIETNSYIE